MTPARKAALQWFHDRGEVCIGLLPVNVGPSDAIVAKMFKDGQLACRVGKYRRRYLSLTDKGRRMLHGDEK